MNANPFKYIKDPSELYYYLIPLLAMGKPKITPKILMKSLVMFDRGEELGFVANNETIYLTFKGRWFMHFMKEYVENNK